MKQLKITKSITQRKENGIQQYLNDVSKIPMITAEQEVEICKRKDAGDRSAVNELVTPNLRFVISVAKQYNKNGNSLMDMINEGNMGLIKASIRFDHTRGFKFITYAVWWIRQAITQYLSDSGRTVRIPLNQIGKINKYTKSIEILSQHYERKPTTSEIADHLNVHEEVVKSSEILSMSVAELDGTRSSNDDSGTLLDTIENTDSGSNTDHILMDDSLKTDLGRVVRTLKPAHQHIIMLHFGLYEDGEPMTLEEVGKTVGKHKERVRQVVISSLRRIRKRDQHNGSLKRYLG